MARSTACRISRPKVAEGVVSGPATPMRISWPARSLSAAATDADTIAAAKIAENLSMLTSYTSFES
jgi:hypothetical protein